MTANLRVIVQEVHSACTVLHTHCLAYVGTKEQDLLFVEMVLLNLVIQGSPRKPKHARGVALVAV